MSMAQVGLDVKMGCRWVSLSSPGFLLTVGAGEFFVVGTLLYTVGCSAASLTSAHEVPATYPLVVTIKNVSRHC